MRPVLAAGKALWGAHNETTMLNPAWRGKWIQMTYLEEQFGELPDGEVAADQEWYSFRASATTWAPRLRPEVSKSSRSLSRTP